MDKWLQSKMKRLGCIEIGCTWESERLLQQRATRMVHAHPARNPEFTAEAQFIVLDVDLCESEDAEVERWEMRVLADHEDWLNPLSRSARAINGEFDEDFERARLRAV